MTGFLRTAAIAAATLCLAGSALANVVSIACLTKNPSSKDWVPEAVFVDINTSTYDAAVLDEFTLQTMDGPVRADVSRPATNRVQLKWKLIGVRDRTDKVQNVNFKMSLNLQRMTFNYSGLGESFFLTPGSASGNCVAKK